MENKSIPIYEDTDWWAVVWSGLISSIVFLIGGSLAATGSGGTLATFIKLIASMVMGASALFNDLNIGSFLIGLFLHLLLSMMATALIALIIHRWGIIVGVIGGGLLGLAIYAINFYFVSDLLFPWMSGLRSTDMAGVHVLFGALAGGFYEIFEDERFETNEWIQD